MTNGITKMILGCDTVGKNKFWREYCGRDLRGTSGNNWELYMSTDEGFTTSPGNLLDRIGQLER